MKNRTVRTANRIGERQLIFKNRVFTHPENVGVTYAIEVPKMISQSNHRKKQMLLLSQKYKINLRKFKKFQKYRKMPMTSQHDCVGVSISTRPTNQMPAIPQPSSLANQRPENHKAASQMSDRPCPDVHPCPNHSNEKISSHII